MKKILAVLLALMLVLVNAAALATDAVEEVEEEVEEEVAVEAAKEEADPYNGLLDVDLKLPKKFTVTGTAPEETFTFKFEGVSYTSPADLVEGKDSTEGGTVPAVADVTITFDEGDTKDEKEVTVTLPMSQYVFGRYIYKVTEVVPDPKTAGIGYAEDKEMYMVVTILSDSDNDPDGGQHFVVVLHEDSLSGKKENRLFENTYDSGSLNITKELAGNMANLEDTFEFAIAFTPEDGTEIADDQKDLIGIDTDGSDGAWEGLTYKVTLGHEQHITFTNIPAGTKYEVTEDSKDYTESREEVGEADGTIDAGDEDGLAVTNTRTVPIDTGVSLETLPYVLLMVVAMAGAVLSIRRREDY